MNLRSIFMQKHYGGVDTNSGGSGGATEPYVKYTTDAGGNITAAALYNYTTIPQRLFYGCTSLKTCDFTNSPNLTSIGAYAFYQCTNLALTSLPDNLTSIGDRAFYECTNLALTSLPKNLASIGAYAFYNCTSLALTSLPKSLTNIAERALSLCTGLQYMEISATKLGTGTQIFNGCTGLVSVWIRNTCTTVTASVNSKAPFTNCSTSLAIYAEPDAKPDGWGNYFNRTGSSGGTTVTVVYGQTECPWTA